jgi:hypothetical protein
MTTHTFHAWNDKTNRTMCGKKEADVQLAPVDYPEYMNCLRCGRALAAQSRVPKTP